MARYGYQYNVFMPKTCDLVPFCPPYNPCTCAHKCDCLCHGKEDKKAPRTLPSDPDAFGTTSRGFHVPPSEDDYPKTRGYRPQDNLGNDPNLVPLLTETQREYTPKHVDREPKARSRAWKGGLPFDPTTVSRDTYKAPSPEDYPARARSMVSPMKSEPGKFDTTYRSTFVKPSDDLYSTTGGVGMSEHRASPPGLFDTEYKTQYIDHPRDRAVPFRPGTTPLGTRPTDFTTTTRGTYKAPSADDYPARERGFKPSATSSGPLSRLTSTARETYRDPGPPEDPLTSTRPSDSKLIVGPTSPFKSTSHDAYGPKKHFCCGCSSS